MFIVKNQFLKFLDGLDTKNVTVTNILNNVFKKDKSNSLVLEKILTIILDSKLDLNADFSKIMTDYINNVSDNLLKSHLKSIYKISDEEAKEYLEFASKVYDLLLGLNNSYLTNKEMIPLSLLVTYNYLKPNFKEFLNSYEITMDTIYNYYNINLDYKAIKNMKVNNNRLVNIYDYFFDYDYRRLSIDNLDDALFLNVFINSFLRTISNIPEDKIEKLFNDFTAKKEKEEEQAYKDYIYQGLDINTADFIVSIANYYNYMIEQGIPKYCTKEDYKFLSIIIASLKCDDENILELLLKNGIEFTSISKKFELTNCLGKCCKYKFIVDELAQDIFKDDIERKDINLRKIVKDAFKINVSSVVASYLKKENITLNYETFDEKYEEAVKKVNQIKHKNQILEELDKFDINIELKIEFVLKTYEYIMNKLDINELKNELNSNLIKDKNDVKELTLIIGTLVYESNFLRFFEKRNITLEGVIKYSGLTIQDLDYIRKMPVNFILYDEFKECFEKNEFLAHYIFSKNNETHVLENIASKFGTNYDHLKVEIELNTDYEKTLSIDDRIEILNNQEVDTINYDNIVSILHFGDSLKIHSDYINDEIPKLANSDTHDEAINNLNNLISGVCKDKEQERKKGLMTLFSKREVKEKMVDLASLTSLKESIDSNIKLLSQEIVGYDTIRRYMEVYYTKIISYFDKAKEVADIVRIEIEKLDPKNPYEYAKFVQLTSLYQVINDKANRFNMTCHLIEQQLLRINQAAANHFITINALETAKNDLLPLIATEIAIAKGIDSEKDAILVTENIMNLFKSLLARNIDEANVNLDMLKKLDLPENYVNALQMDLMQYSSQIQSAKMVTPSLEHVTIESDSNENKPKQKNLLFTIKKD